MDRNMKQLHFQNMKNILDVYPENVASLWVRHIHL